MTEVRSRFITACPECTGRLRQEPVARCRYEKSAGEDSRKKSQYPMTHLRRRASSFSATTLLLLLIEVIGPLISAPVDPQVSPLNIAVGTSLTNAFDGMTYGGASFLEHSNGLEIFSFIREMAGPTSLKYFGADGSLLAAGPTMAGSTSARTNIQKELMKSLVFDTTSVIGLYGLSQNPDSTFAITQLAVVNDAVLVGLPYQVLRGVNDPSSLYVYLADASRKIWRVDSSLLPLSVASSATIHTTVVAVHNLLVYQTDSLILSLNAPVLYFATKSTLSLSATVPLLQTFSGSGLNNLNSAQYYALRISPPELRCIDLTASLTASAQVEAHTFLSLLIAIETDVVNFGPTNYLGLFHLANARFSMLFVDKTTFTKVVTELDIADYYPSLFTLATSDSMKSNQMTFGYVLSNPPGYNVQMFRVTFDNCATRSGPTCSVCLSDFVHDPTDAVACLHYSQIADGFGQEISTQTVVACQTGCLKCKKDSTKCTGCSAQYTLSGSQCLINPNGNPTLPPVQTLPGSRIVAAEYMGEYSSGTEYASFSFYHKLNPSGISLTAGLIAFICKNIQFSIEFIDPNNSLEVVQFTTISYPDGNHIVTSLFILEKPLDRHYNVSIGILLQTLITLTSPPETFSIVQIAKGLLRYDDGATKDELESAIHKGNVLAVLTGGRYNENVLSSSVIGAVAAIDPTGIMIKFAQVLKLVNKLYYININFGRRLDAFLKRLEQEQIDHSISDKQLAVYSKTYRGKLTRSLVSVDGAFQQRLLGTIFYLFSWFLLFIKKLVQFINLKVPKFALYLMFYSSKLHLIIFNLVFIDFIWFATRTVLHSRNLSGYIIAANWGIILLVIADMWHIMDFTLNDKVWQLILFKQVKIRSTAKQHTKIALLAKQPKNGNPKSKESEESEKFKFGKSKQRPLFINRPGETETDPDKLIDYNQTYQSIGQNPHLMSFAKSTLRVKKEIFAATLCRSVYLLNIVRITAYLLLICAGQYTSGFMLSLLLSMELSKSVYTLACYFKYRYQKNMICLLMEGSQSVFLFFFLLVCILVHRKRFDESITDFYQDAGIWIVIASCVAEYLLLLTYIGVAAYEFFKNRKNQIKADNTTAAPPSLIPTDFIVYKTSLRSGKSLNSSKSKRVGLKISPRITANVKLTVNKFNRGLSISIHSKNLESLNISANLAKQKPSQKIENSRLHQANKKSKF